MLKIKSDFVSTSVGRPGELVFKVHTVQGTSSSYRRINVNGTGCKIRLEGGLFYDGTSEKTVSSSTNLIFEDATNEFFICIDAASLTAVNFKVWDQNSIEYVKGLIETPDLIFDGLWGENHTAFDIDKSINSSKITRLVSSPVDSFVAKNTVFYNIKNLKKLTSATTIELRNQKYVYGNISGVQNAACASVNLRATGISGDVANAVCPALTYFNISQNADVFGNVEDFFVNNSEGRTNNLALTWGGRSSYPIRWHGTNGGGDIRSFVAEYSEGQITVKESNVVKATYDGNEWSYV